MLNIKKKQPPYKGKDLHFECLKQYMQNLHFR